MRKIFATLLMMIMLLSFAAPAFADGGNVSYLGRSELFLFEPGSKESKTDLFSELKEVMPGDELTDQILVNNKSNKKIKVYMKALGEQDGSTEGFLSQMTLTVNQDGSKELFNATADQTAGLTDWVLLGTVAKGKSVTLDVTLSVPIEMDNEFMDAIGILDWQFKIEEIDPPADDDEPDQPYIPPVEPVEPPVEPVEPPVEPVEPPVEPVEPPVEPGPLPQTGQLWWPVIALVCVGLVFLIAGARRKDEE